MPIQGGGEESLMRLGSVSSVILMRVRSIQFDKEDFVIFFCIVLAGATTGEAGETD